MEVDSECEMTHTMKHVYTEAITIWISFKLLLQTLGVGEY